MTPRVGVKTTLTMERAFSGLPVPSGGPNFLFWGGTAFAEFLRIVPVFLRVESFEFFLVILKR
jgi:hypothetical protein